MPFELHIALRYLLAKRKQAVVSVVAERHAPQTGDWTVSIAGREQREV